MDISKGEVDYSGRGVNISTERIRFENPDLKSLAGKGLASVDMHLHTDHSDAALTVEKALQKARKEGFGIAITDHNVISGSLRAFDEARGTIVVPGIEVSAADGPHILAYFHSPNDLKDFYIKHIAPKKRSSPWLAIRSDTPTIVDALAKYSCMTVAAHPYGYLMFNKGLQKCIDLEYLPPEVVDGFQGFEVICGGMAHSLNLKAVELVERKGKCFTGGTDGHILQDLGSVVTCAHAFSHTEFLDAVAARENLVVGKEKDPFEKMATGTMLLGKHSRYFLPSMQVHFEQNLPRIKHYFDRKVRQFKEWNEK
jgi:hypothetical protein